MADGTNALDPRSPAGSRAFPLRRFGGAEVARIVDSAHVQVAEHAHDWPVLSLYVSGELINRTELGTERIASPSAVFYRGGDAHENRTGPNGFEQIQIEFDPAWVRGLGAEIPDRPRRWIGGRAAAEAQRLARVWASAADERELARATARFFGVASSSRQPAKPWWIDRASERLRSHSPPPTRVLAGELGLSPAWLAESWRQATGEGLPRALRRRRVEAAANLLRTTDASAAEIAAAAGFCDQGHMIRAFRAVLGRTPGTVRSEWTRSPRG